MAGGPGVGGAGLLGSEALALSAADKGRGGPMVPNKMDASWVALRPAAGRSSSSSDVSFSESTTDHSSSSGRTRDGRCPEVGVVLASASTARLAFSWVRRWKGFVETSLVAGAVGAAGVTLLVDGLARAGSLFCASFLRNGFLVSTSWAAGGVGVAAGAAMGAGGGLVGSDVGGIGGMVDGATGEES